MFYEWRVRESDGGYVAEGGHVFSVEDKNIFVVFTTARFDNRKQALRYVDLNDGKEYNSIWKD